MIHCRYLHGRIVDRVPMSASARCDRAATDRIAARVGSVRRQPVSPRVTRSARRHAGDTRGAPALDFTGPARLLIGMNGITAGEFPTRFLRDDGWRTATGNERLVMDLLSRHGPASRADLARWTGLAPHSITRLVEPLLARGLLGESAPVVAGRGKPATRISLAGDAAFSIGISVMTDAVSLALLDLAGTIAGARSERLEDSELHSACGQIGRMMADAIAGAGRDRATLIGIGVGVTGYFIGDGARLNPPRLLDSWALVPLDTILAEAFGHKVWIDNDGNVAAIGEAMLGQGREVRDFAYLYFSAGFGGGVISNGQLLRGRHGNAGEFASILPADWPQPNLEALRVAFSAAGVDYPDLHGMLGAFDPDHAAVDAWLDASMVSLDLVASSISATLDPGAIVLGGRLPRELARRMADRITFTNPERRGHHRPGARIVASMIDGDAAAIGAATLPLKAAFFPVSDGVPEKGSGDGDLSA
jgi:predicted NBD/HSP70 family sugar kinase